MNRHTRLFLTVLGCAMCVAALLLVVSSCVEPVGPFDNPYDPENPDSPFSYDLSAVSGTGEVQAAAESGAVTLRWSAVDHATMYHLQVARDGRFSDMVHDDEVAPGTTAAEMELEAESRYHWRVRYEAEVTRGGTTSAAWGLWCGPWEVTVRADDSGDGDGDIPFDEGQSFLVGVDSAVELVLEPELHGGLTDRWFEPLFYRTDGSELDSMTSLEGNLATLPIASISVDGDLSDWDSIAPFTTDDDGDYSEDVSGSDLTDLYLARGENDELYVGFRLSDNQTNPETIYVFHLANSPGFGWGSPGFAVYHDGSGWRGAVTNGEGLPSDADGGDMGEYSIGDRGPAGGWIFYENPNYANDGWRYLEAARPETEWIDKEWGGYDTDIGGDDGDSPPELTGIGDGYANTEAIVAAYGAAEPHNRQTDYPAKMCWNLAYGGYDDWFLPSSAELQLMYANLHTADIGGFVSDDYWSSSENTSYYIGAEFVDFSLGHVGVTTKGYAYLRVRAIRAF
jgi:hypothetical protein